MADQSISNHPQGRKSTNPGNSSSLWKSTVSVGSAALAAYGAYHLASLAVEAWNEGDDHQNSHEQQEQPQKTPDVEQTILFDEQGRAPSPANRLFSPSLSPQSDDVDSSQSSPLRGQQPPRSNQLHVTCSPDDIPNQNFSQTSSFTKETARCSAGVSPSSESAATSSSIGHKLSSALWHLATGSSTSQGKTDSPQHLLNRGPAQQSTSPRRPARTMRERRRLLSKARTQVRQVLYRLHPTTLKRSVLDATNFQAERQALQQIRQAKQKQQKEQQDQTEEVEAKNSINNDHIHQQEKALWNTIAVQTLTRFLVTQYATCILFVVLTVQVTVLLGHQSSSDCLQDSTGLMEDSRWILEQTYQYFFQHGLPSLIQTVRRIVSSELQSSPDTWTVTNACSLQQLKELFQKVQSTLHLPHEGGKSIPRSMLRFAQSPSALMDDFECDQDAFDHRLDLMDETWDILESPLVRDALVDALETHQDQLLAGLSIGDFPLAQVLTNMKKACSQVFDSFTSDDVGETEEAPKYFDVRQNPHLTALEHLPSILELMDVCSA